MEFELSERDGHLAITGAMNMYCACALKDALLSAVRDRRGEALIDLSGGSEIDTAGIQVLLMLRRLAAASGSRFAIIDPSAAVTEVLELYGLAGVIERHAPIEGAAS